MSKLKAPFGRVVVSVDIEGKNSHTFSGGTKIRLERNNNNLNRREVSPVNATVLSSEYMPEGSEVLISHNAVHDVNRLFNFTPLSGESEASDIKYYSLPDSECFVYREPGQEEWIACKGYATGLRIFKPYTGILENISPTVIKNKLFITSGSLKNKVVCTLKSCDYQIVYQDKNGREGNIIRVRHFDTEELHERQEVICVDNEMTKYVFDGKILIGISVSDAKQLNEVVC